MRIATLELDGIRKVFPGTTALDGVTVRWEAGYVHALIGRNGAGKSTLVNIMTGALAQTSGSIRLNGAAVNFHSPADARRSGIAAVHQELSLIPELDVAENILLGRLPRKPGVLPGRVDWPNAYRQAEELLARLDVHIDHAARVSSLSVAQQQLVEIAKAMADDPSILLLDEPTSALSRHEADHVFALIRTLTRRGVLILYITHRLQEIGRIADTVTALRDGFSTPTIPIAHATPEVIVTMMFGQNIRFSRMVETPAACLPVMEVRALSRTDAFHDVSFTLHKGEILGIAGLLGSGRTELLRTLAGADIPSGGTVLLEGECVYPRSPAQMKRLGVVLIPENRKDQGLVQMLSVRSNICLASLDRIAAHGFTTRRREMNAVRSTIGDLAIVAPNPEFPVSSLSGGNQQKVVLGKWLNTQPRIMLFDEPTRGIDLQAKLQIFRLIIRLSTEGISSLIVSSELEELMDICHRILIMKNGRVAGFVDPSVSPLDELFGLCMQ
jgi:ABC-type sugar transport system ATPase subunit